MSDILPQESWRWRWLENQFVAICHLFGYRELRLPLIEHTELFQRGVGEATDIVRKEMYTFPDRSDRSLTLRPEITAGVVRAFVQHKLYNSEVMPLKLFTYGSLFRYERPQSGRYRQFNQFDIEVFGSSLPQTDAEIIAVGMAFFQQIGLTDTEVELNTIGCNVCRPQHRQALMAFLQERLPHLCSDCHSRFELNPLRVFDCKNDNCQQALTGIPLMQDYLCQECQDHFAGVKLYLDYHGISYTLNNRLVRGLDYYNRTVFEFFDPQTRAEQGALGGGGRYDPLVAVIGGPEVPGAGFGLGVERILTAISAPKLPEPTCDLFFSTVGKNAEYHAIALMRALRQEGISCEMDLSDRGLRSHMRRADRLQVPLVAILGDNELTEKVVILRNMQTKEQITVAWEDLAAQVLRWLR